MAVHAEDGGDFLFGEQKDLQHEVVAFVGAAAQAGLADEDEAGDEDGLHCNDGLEQAEGFGVEVVGVGHQVEDDPCGEDAEVRGDEGETADELSDVVGEPLGGGALGEELLFVFGDEFDVSLEVSLGHRGFRRTVCVC